MGAFDHLEWTYDGAFEQLFGLRRGKFEQKFSKNSNGRGIARGWGMFRLRFDWYITLHRGGVNNNGKFQMQWSSAMSMKGNVCFKAEDA